MNTIVNYSYTKASILAFLKNQVSKRIFKAISLILSPCCSTEIVEVVFECDDDNPGNYIVTITLSEPINFGGAGKGILLVGESTAHVGTSGLIFDWPDGKNIVLSDVDLFGASGSSDVFLQAFLPVGGHSSMVNIQSAIAVTVPTCP